MTQVAELLTLQLEPAAELFLALDPLGAALSNNGLEADFPR